MACPLAAASAGTTDPDYGYTGDGLRAWKQVGSVRTYFLYDGETPVNELDATGTVQAVNTFGPTGLLSRHTTSGNASTFYAFDPTGNVAERLDGSGNILAQYTFDAFGMRMGTDSSVDPYSGFGGQWGYYSDGETVLELLTNRYYDSGTGRFVTRDPISYSGGINIYSYTANNPTNNIDPFGLDTLKVLQDAGGFNQGGHSRIYVSDANGKTGNWYGYYPSDPDTNGSSSSSHSSSSHSSSSHSSSSSNSGTGPGFVRIEDTPTSVDLAKGHIVVITISPQQSRQIRYNIFRPKKPYDLGKHNCSTWAADVLRPTFPGIPVNVTTPKELFDVMNTYDGRPDE